MTDYACTEERFAKDVEKFTMYVIRDEEGFRHIKFRFVDGAFRWFDVITWGGHLYIGGDCETFVFARITDMFEFFRQGRGINPHYWQEKITDGRERAEEFSVESFKARAQKEFDNWLESSDYEGEDADDIREDFDTSFDDVEDEETAIMFFRDFSVADFNFRHWDTFPGHEFTFQYIWVCRAIRWAIERYDEHKAAQS